MKKLLTLSFAVLFVVALSSLSFAQPVVVAEDVAPVADVVDCGCGPVVAGCYAPVRPFFRSFCAAPVAGASCCEPCPAPCPRMRPVRMAPRPVVCAPPRPVCVPEPAPCVDPCAYPAVGYRTPVRGFLGRLFAPRYYDYGVGCPPCGE